MSAIYQQLDLLVQVNACLLFIRDRLTVNVFFMVLFSLFTNIWIVMVFLSIFFAIRTFLIFIAFIGVSWIFVDFLTTFVVSSLEKIWDHSTWTTVENFTFVAMQICLGLINFSAATIALILFSIYLILRKKRLIERIEFVAFLTEFTLNWLIYWSLEICRFLHFVSSIIFQSIEFIYSQCMIIVSFFSSVAFTLVFSQDLFEWALA